MKTRHLYLCILLLISAFRAPNEYSTSGDTLFTLLDSSTTGVDFTNSVQDTKEQNILIYANFYGGAGVGVGDFNNDGLQDLFFAGNLVSDRLYLNTGNLEFKDITRQAGIKDDGGWSTGVTVADVNNDGNLDIYVSRELYDDKPELRTNLLYINNGDGTFVESAKKWGVADSQRTRHATFLDFDKDGFLDLFLLTQPPNPGSQSAFNGATLLKPEYHLKLLKNTGSGAFKDVSKIAGVSETGFPNGVSASDINNDGWVDLYVANDFYAPDFLFINNQDGTFTNQIDVAMQHIPYYSMGVDVADINNDGLLDIFVVDMAAEDNFRSKSNMSGMDPKAFWKVVNQGGHYQYMYNALQLNNGNNTFSDAAQLTGMATTDWSWSNLIADFDNDGLKDTYVTNGLLYDIRNTDADKNVQQYINKTRLDWIMKHPDGGGVTSVFDILDLDKVLELIPSQPLKNYAFKNQDNLEFQNIADKWGLDQPSFSNGASYADLDNDGDLDLVVNNINAPAFIYKNNSEERSASNYLRIQPQNEDNKPVFETRVSLYAKGQMQLQELTNVRGIYSTSESVLHFGLGSIDRVDSIEIRWPNNTVSVLRDLSANQVLKVSMNKDTTEESRKTAKTISLFQEDQDELPIVFNHRENIFDDYEKQILLPHKLSQFGPSLAVGDVNNDGLEDVFLGGATGEKSSLFIQNEDGKFDLDQGELWESEKMYEDVDAVIVDIDGDGDQDLYVVSGGNEFPENDPLYRDRLYLNDGNGNFVRESIDSQSAGSGSIVRVADYDKDGDADFFIGNRHVPHQYPAPASSQILRNDSGQLTDVTSELADGLNDLGLVTDALWSDYDTDGDLDLVIVGEWMQITFFENEEGKLSRKEVKGLEESNGWWFSIEQGDFDNDGDQDFIAGNLGLNYKYKTSGDKPFDIYYEDFDKNGSNDIVLGYYSKDKHYPLRGFSCSSSQIPSLKKKIQKYDVFATLEIDQIYGEKNLVKSLHYEVQTFASSYIENLGNGNFKISELPRLAQLSNINDILVKDFNGDGYLDALAAGNFFVSEIETPRNDAGTGVLLLGNGAGTFECKSSRETGFFASRDARKMATLQMQGSQKILVANNDDLLQSFTTRGNSKK